MNLLAAIKLLFTRKHFIKASKKVVLNHVEHLFDETQSMPSTWMNLHGYRAENGTYYVCGDYRFLGIRIQNVIIECTDYSAYEHWLNNGIHSTGCFYEQIIYTLPYTRGNSVDTCYVFNTTDGKTKDYNVDQKSDLYAHATSY